MEVGAGEAAWQVGVRVAVAPNIGCGVCAQCIAGWTNLCADYMALGISLDGGFAEYLLIPAAAVRQGNVLPIPNGVPYYKAALAEPLSSCLNGQEAVRVGLNDVVLVIGAGPMGAMHVLLAKVAGARRVMISGWPDARLERARACGADLVINPQREDLRTAVLDATQGQGADVIIVAAGSRAAQEGALELARRQGRINFFAGLPKDEPYIQFDSNLVHYKQLIVTGTTGSSLRQYRAAMDLIASGRLSPEPVVGARIPLQRILEGFERSHAKREMRILVEPFA